MKSLVVGQDHVVGPWVCERAGGTWCPGRGTTIGLQHSEEGLVAGVLAEDYNGANLLMHVAAKPGKTWFNYEFFWFCFYYAFVQLNCKRVTAPVAESNTTARQFVERLGFDLEATLEDAHPEGALLLYRMRKQTCRWLEPPRKFHGNGKVQLASDP